MARRQTPPKHIKSYAAMFREVFEKAEQNGGVPPEISEPKPSYQNLASRFRKVFEEAEQNVNIPKEAPPLAYYARGVPVITAVGRIMRYVYADGAIDNRSTVSPEVKEKAYEIGGFATKLTVTVESASPATLTPQQARMTEPLERRVIAA